MNPDSGRGLIMSIESRKDVAKAVRSTSQVAKEMGFRESSRFAIATTASELGTNIVKYAGTGYLKLEPVQRSGSHGLELTAQDDGPGIEDVAAAMQDGYSTSGGLGVGLSGVERMMDEMEIDSGQDKGTRIIVRKWRRSG